MKGFVWLGAYRTVFFSGCCNDLMDALDDMVTVKVREYCYVTTRLLLATFLLTVEVS